MNKEIDEENNGENPHFKLNKIQFGFIISDKSVMLNRDYWINANQLLNELTKPIQWSSKVIVKSNDFTDFYGKIRHFSNAESMWLLSATGPFQWFAHVKESHQKYITESNNGICLYEIYNKECNKFNRMLEMPTAIVFLL